VARYGLIDPQGPHPQGQYAGGKPLRVPAINCLLVPGSGSLAVLANEADLWKLLEMPGDPVTVQGRGKGVIRVLKRGPDIRGQPATLPKGGGLFVPILHANA